MNVQVIYAKSVLLGPFSLLQSSSYSPEQASIVLDQVPANIYQGQYPSSLKGQSGVTLDQIPANIYHGQYPSSLKGQSRPWGNLAGQLSSTNLPGQYSAKGFGRQKRGTKIPNITLLFSF